MLRLTGRAFRNLTKLDNSSFNLGLKHILNENDISTRILRTTYPEAVEMVIETFQLNICEDQLMSRCTKCNDRFIQKPLSIKEAIKAAKGFQGTQYHNAVQKFIDVCKISSTA
ncbi:hypothetical protein Tco_0462975 [Tanacetum coccineum]